MTAAAAVKSAELNGFTKSLLMHVFLLTALGGWHWWNTRQAERFGDPNSLGASAGVSAVAQIPIMRREGRVNPVANDTDSQLPTPEKQQPKPKVEREDPDAIAIAKKQKKTPQEQIASTQKYRPDPVLPNQVTSNMGRALVSPTYGVKGSGGVGASENSPFGDRLGWYGKLIQERIGQKWHTEDVDQNLRRAPRVVVTFNIARNGAVSNVRIVQSSGVYALDYSVQRAVHEASPLPPLPDQFDRPYAQCEFHFELLR
jgi:protein TonB